MSILRHKPTIKIFSYQRTSWHCLPARTILLILISMIFLSFIHTLVPHEKKKEKKLFRPGNSSIAQENTPHLPPYTAKPNKQVDPTPRARTNRETIYPLNSYFHALVRRAARRSIWIIKSPRAEVLSAAPRRLGENRACSAYLTSHYPERISHALSQLASPRLEPYLLYIELKKKSNFLQLLGAQCISYAG